MARRASLVVVLFILGALSMAAQEPVYFVTYSHAMEEPGNLEISFKGVQGSPKYGNPFLSETLELEYGAKAWWTTELYLDGQHTWNDSTVFNGFRWENRFRPLFTEHFINPVLYIEYENLNEADRALLEVVGHDSVADMRVGNTPARAITERALDLKLILSSNTHGWNIAENFIAEKNFVEPEPWEFGYALGVSRPLSLKGSAHACFFCRENFAAGAELYGGLGDLDGFGLKQTSHYFGPAVSFDIPSGPSISFSPSFGLNRNSAHVLYRFTVSYEVQQIFGRLWGSR